MAEIMVNKIPKPDWTKVPPGPLSWKDGNPTSDLDPAYGLDFAGEKVEYHGELDWEPITREALSTMFADQIETPYAAHWQGAGPTPSYSLVDAFMDAAQGQPGVPYGFRSGFNMPQIIIRCTPEGEYEIGKNINPEGFASIGGNDGDEDEDDLPIYPSPSGGGAPRESRRREADKLVERLLGEPKQDLTESEADAIAKRLLGE